MARSLLLGLLAVAALLSGCASDGKRTGPAATDGSLGAGRTGKPLVRASFHLVQPLPEVPPEMTVYETLTPTPSRDDVARFMKVLRLDGEIVDRKQQFVVRDGTKTLEVFKQPGTGYLRYCDDAAYCLAEAAEKLPAEEEAVRRAGRLLKELGWLPANASFQRVDYQGFRMLDNKGALTREGKTGLVVQFGFNLDNTRVVGPGAKASVAFGDNAEIIGAASIWRALEPRKVTRIISPEEALARFKQRWPKEAADRDEFERADIRTDVSIEKVYLAYFAEPGRIVQSYLEPVYVFESRYKITRRIQGAAEIEQDYFEVIIPAVQHE